MPKETSKCVECHAGAPLEQDKHYSEDLCTTCFASRRNEAKRASHWEWFESNKLLDNLTDAEKLMIGA